MESRPLPSPRPAATAPAADAHTAAAQPPLTVEPPGWPSPIPDSGTSVIEMAPPAPVPARPEMEELTVAQNAVIGIRLDSSVSTRTAHVEDRLLARVTRDVTVEGRTVIPSGARLEGYVSVLERGGKFKDRARLGVRFTSVLLDDGTRIPIQTETIFRDGEPPANDAASKIGASAVIGTILGAIVGGKKGAAIGSGVGAAGGTAAVANSDANEAVIAAGTPLTVRLTAPVSILVEKK